VQKLCWDLVALQKYLHAETSTLQSYLLLLGVTCPETNVHHPEMFFTLIQFRKECASGRRKAGNYLGNSDKC